MYLRYVITFSLATSHISAEATMSSQPTLDIKHLMLNETPHTVKLKIKSKFDSKILI